MTLDAAWLDARIAKAKTIVEAYEDAITALQTDGVYQHTLDTGQTREVVTRQDLARMQGALAAAENRLATLCARRYGGSTIVGPGW